MNEGRPATDDYQLTTNDYRLPTAARTNNVLLSHTVEACMAWLDDLRVALRRCRRQPTFTLVVILTLALGLGANTAVFTLVDALMLRSLPVERPEELYRLGDTNNCCVNSGLQTRWSLL